MRTDGEIERLTEMPADSIAAATTKMGPTLDQFALGGLHMSNAPSVAPRQHSGTECLPPRNQPSWPELPHRHAEDPKTLLPQADNPYTWPRFRGAFLRVPSIERQLGGESPLYSLMAAK